MKKFLKYLLLIALFSLWGIILTNKEQTGETVKTARKEIFEVINKPCSKPLKYSIGTVDDRFGISPDDLMEISLEAEKVWEDSAGKNLLEYNPQAEFKINLTYDERQKQSDAEEKLKENLSGLKISQETLTRQYASIQDTYDRKLEIYEKKLNEYRDKSEEYNKEVEYWNERGGAPEDKYDELEDEKNKLEDLFDDLKDRQKEINKLIGKSNNLAEQENKIVSQYNSSLTTYKMKYGDMREFEKGIFGGKEINVYQFKETADLRLTLAHEFGHYLGINHTDNSASIMYYLIGDQNMDNLTLANEDLAELKNICQM
jgi:hypothetical protein